MDWTRPSVAPSIDQDQAANTGLPQLNPWNCGFLCIAAPRRIAALWSIAATLAIASTHAVAAIQGIATTPMKPARPAQAPHPMGSRQPMGSINWSRQAPRGLRAEQMYNSPTMLPATTSEARSPWQCHIMAAQCQNSQIKM